LKNLIKTEFFKLSRSRTLWGMTTIMCIYLFIASLVTEIEAVELIPFLLDNIFTLSITLPMYGIVLAHEYTAGYFKESIFSGKTRIQVYMSRYLSFSSGIVMILLLPVLAIIAFYFIKDGGIELIVACDAALVVDVICLVLYCFCIAAFLMMCIMIEKSYAAVVLLCIIYNIVYVFINEIFPISDMPNWVRYSFVGIQGELFITKDSLEWMKIGVTLLGQTLIFNGIGYVVFKKRELR